VTEMLWCEQVSNRQHVSESFRPDHSSSSFQRPTSTSNTARGFPKFLPLTSLDGPQSVYVREDTMFVRVMVDCRDL